MIVPDATERKALFIIDVQPLTCKGDIPPAVTKDIVRYIKKTPYEAYILAEYYAPPSTMFYKQHDFTLSEEETGKTCETIRTALQPIQDLLFEIKKTTRSCFKSPDQEALQNFLEQKGIEEIHFVGFDINDCVLASAYEAIDSGYYSFVLEELCHQNSGIQELKDAALAIFRRQNMTNNSLHEKIGRKTVNLSD